VQRRETVIEEGGTVPDLLGAQWDEVIAAFDGPEGAALSAFRKLQRTIYGSELIARDRDAALAGYLLEFDKAARIFGKQKEAEGVTRGAIGDDLLSAVSSIPEIYEPLSKDGNIDLSDKETDELRSGSTAWARSARLRIALSNEPPGSVADTIMSAKPAR